MQKLAAAGVKTFALGSGEIAAGDPTLLNEVKFILGCKGPEIAWPRYSPQHLPS